MTMYAPSITIDDIVDALVAVLAPFVPNGEMVRAQVNLVPQIPAIGVVITEMMQVDLETPSFKYTTGQYDIKTPTRCDLQLDFYGEGAGDYLRAFKSAFRSVWCSDQFPNGIAPLYCSDGIQSPLINGEKQYATRWTCTVSLQYNAGVIVPQAYATSLTLDNMIDGDLL